MPTLQDAIPLKSRGLANGGRERVATLELLDRGDPSFVDAIRDYHDADALAAFAEVWFADARPDSRRLLLEYLDRPLNAYRHEGLIKRLFKKAEGRGR